jgi:molybdopterin converting factor small subunit
MIIAQEKKKHNLAEYILYMWQVEDIIRAYKFNMDAIEKNIVAQFQQPEEKHKEILDWYANLVEMMKIEKVEERGHLQILKNNVNELYDFHLHLLNQTKDAQYTTFFQQASGNISEFRQKAQATDENNDIEVCLTALYGILMLKLQGKEISKDTLAAVTTFSQLIADLTAKYKAFEEEEQ